MSAVLLSAFNLLGVLDGHSAFRKVYEHYEQEHRYDHDCEADKLPNRHLSFRAAADNGFEFRNDCYTRRSDNTDEDQKAYAVADTVVGKAAALLFVKCKIKCVYAETLSEKGERILRLYGLDFEYGTLAKCIINRAGTDICPMEKAVEDTDDPEEAYLLLKIRRPHLKREVRHERRLYYIRLK